MRGVTRLLFCASLLIQGLAVHPQENFRVAAGASVSDNLANLASGLYAGGEGFSFQPFLTFRISPNVSWSTTIGVSKVSFAKILFDNNQVYQETRYNNRGHYWKTGPQFTIEQGENSPLFVFGINLMNSEFREYGTFTIRGSNFGDYTGEYWHGIQSTTYIEPYFDVYLFARRRFTLMLTIREPIKIGETLADNCPHFYIPGRGLRMRYTDSIWQLFFYKIDFSVVIPIIR
ncbi:MAG: hypothetical protein KKA07_13825 [Bacteroidetes bacterium]|nr:hypothetical protein [Bacteroidota bacterium]MBU1720140.1 hypothetical protein [Bacteroidota bacterium]